MVPEPLRNSVKKAENLQKTGAKPNKKEDRHAVLFGVLMTVSVRDVFEQLGHGLVQAALDLGGIVGLLFLFPLEH